MDRVRISRKEEIADGTIAVHLEKPAGFAYTAGQRASFATSKNAFDTRHEWRSTFASAPHEEALMFVIRNGQGSDHRSVYCSEGAELEMEGPYGEFVLRSDEREHVIGIAGGIGIAPFFSMVKDLKERRAERTMTLFYADRDPDSAVFLEELYALADEMPSFTIVATMMNGDDVGFSWESEWGPVTSDMIKAYVPSLREAMFYLSGPFDMVKAAKDTVRSMGVLDARVRVETSAGH